MPSISDDPIEEYIRRSVFTPYMTNMPLRYLLSDKDVIAIRSKMIAEGRRGPIMDADVEAYIFSDERPDS